MSNEYKVLIDSSNTYFLNKRIEALFEQLYPGHRQRQKQLIRTCEERFSSLRRGLSRYIILT